MSSRAKKKQSVNNRMPVVPPAPLNVLSYSDQQISSSTGIKMAQLKTYLSTMEEKIKKDCILEAQEKLWKAEDYIAVANVLILVYAIKMSRKSREKTKDLINRMLENLNPAREYVERVGVQKAYEYAHEDFGIELEFDSVDMNKEFGFSDHDFREEGFEGKTGLEIWNEAWEDAKDLISIINTCSMGLVLKSEFGFTSVDLDKLIKLSNEKTRDAKNAYDGVTKLVDEYEARTGLRIGGKNKNLVRRYGL